MKREHNSEWDKELNSLNTKNLPLYIYASITGLLSYSLFDYYAIAALWKQFIVLRVLCSVNGLVLLTFLKRNKISPQQLIIIFHMGVFLFSPMAVHSWFGPISFLHGI